MPLAIREATKLIPFLEDGNKRYRGVVHLGMETDTLDAEGAEHTAILSYSVKYASSLYGPFRDALDSAPRAGDKQMLMVMFLG